LGSGSGSNDVNTGAALSTAAPTEYDADFIVVGSGAGGGTVAARLAESGYRVLLLEAGGDPRTMIGATAQTPGVNSLPDDYDVPAFHAMATENDAMRWDFFVRHYADSAKQARDPNYRETLDGKTVDGVLYPRAAALGGRWEPGHSGLMYDTTTLLVHLREEDLTIAIAADAPNADLEAALTQSYGGPSLLELVESLAG
jgi:flavin-dependent dehydrogenase